MTSYSWQRELKDIYDAATLRFRDGARDPDKCFSSDEKAALATIGLKPINVVDYIEDYVTRSEPDWESFLLVAAARRDYFLYEQNGEWLQAEVDSSKLPPKSEALEGIEWLPRIIQKAQRFLDGRLCSDIMYGCGGDRKFLIAHRVHPADFLRMVWAARGDQKKVLQSLKHHGA